MHALEHPRSHPPATPSSQGRACTPHDASLSRSIPPPRTHSAQFLALAPLAPRLRASLGPPPRIPRTQLASPLSARYMHRKVARRGDSDQALAVAHCRRHVPHCWDPGPRQAGPRCGVQLRTMPAPPTVGNCPTPSHASFKLHSGLRAPGLSDTRDYALRPGCRSRELSATGPVSGPAAAPPPPVAMALPVSRWEGEADELQPWDAPKPRTCTHLLNACCGVAAQESVLPPAAAARTAPS